MAAFLRSRVIKGSVFGYFGDNVWLKPASVALCVHSYPQHSIACVKHGERAKFENVHVLHAAAHINSKYQQSNTCFTLLQGVSTGETDSVNNDGNLILRNQNGQLATGTSNKELAPRTQDEKSFTRNPYGKSIPRHTYPQLCFDLQLIDKQNKLLFLQTKQNNISLLNCLPQVLLNDRTELAIMTLSYNDKWLKHFQPVYEEALRTHFFYKPNCKIRKTKLKTHNPLCKREEKSASAKEDYMVQNLAMETSYHTPRIETVWFANFCKESEKPKRSSTPDECDPTQLATVFLALRDELPLFLQKGHGYSLYHSRVTFINGLTGITTSGLTAYKSMMTTMRLAAQACMADTTIDILKITENLKECNVKVRWRLSGVPRYCSIINRRGSWDDDKIRYVDGFSIFEVGHDGLIHCHRLQKLMPSKSPEADKIPVWALNPTAFLGLLRHKNPEMLARKRVEDVDGVFSAVIPS